MCLICAAGRDGSYAYVETTPLDALSHVLSLEHPSCVAPSGRSSNPATKSGASDGCERIANEASLSPCTESGNQHMDAVS